MALTVRVIIGPEAYIEFTPEEGFSFTGFLCEVRDKGYFFNGENVYVPYHAIESILMGEFSATPGGRSFKAPLQ